MDHLRSLSRTNASPSEEQSAEIRTHLPILEEELRYLDVQLNILLTQRGRLRDRINLCRAALAPHKRLPPELIREILLFSTAEYAIFPLVDGAKEPRLVVSQVCSAWRAVAFDTPALWNIKIPYLPAVPSSSLELVGGWLSQCSSAGFSLNMIIGAIDIAKMESTDWTDPQVKHKFDWVLNHIIIPNSCCFHELALAIPHLDAKTICALPSGYFPKLRTVAIVQVDSFFTPFTWDTPVTAFSQTPRLRRCDFLLSGVHPHDLQFPWAQLTQLVLINKSISNQTIVPVLSACTSVAAVHLGCVTFESPDGDSSLFMEGSLCLPNILVFSVAFTYSNKTSNAPFLHSFYLPNIRRLVLKNTSGPNWSPSDYIVFLGRISSTLETFELDLPHSRGSYHHPPGNVENLLECMPHTKTVRLPNDAPLLPSTMKRIGDGTLLPHVEFFEFAATANNLLLSIDMLSSRQSTASSTVITSSRSVSKRSVSFLKAGKINCIGMVPEAFKSVRNFQMKGMDVIFH